MTFLITGARQVLNVKMITSSMADRVIFLLATHLSPKK